MLTSTSIPSILHHPEFHDLPLPLLRLSLGILAKQGKAQVFKGTTDEDGQEEGEGVKFV